MNKGADAIAASSGSATHAAEDGRGSYHGNKPLQEIEDDIARTRVRLNTTIEALEHKLLTPGGVIDNAVEALRDSLKPPPDLSRGQAAAYAIPMALIAAGLGWLFMLRRRNWQTDALADYGKGPANVAATEETRAAATTSQKPEDSFAR
jgi:hypothetical protein